MDPGKEGHGRQGTKGTVREAYYGLLPGGSGHRVAGTVPSDIPEKTKRNPYQSQREKKWDWQGIVIRDRD